MDTSDTFKKKIPRLQELQLTVEGTLLLPSRDPDDTLCALDNKEKNELVSQRLDDGSIPDNIILLYREILFTKSLEDYEEKEKKNGSVTVFAISTKRAAIRQEIAFVPR